MATFAEVLRYLTQTVFGIYIFAVLLRLLLQLARADFYNPISQFVVKLSNPLVLPLRRVIPSIGRLDSATVLLALMLQFLATIIVLGLLGVPFGTPNPLIVIVWSAVGILSLVVKVYFFAILAMIIFSWIAPHSHHPARALLHQLTEPAMAGRGADRGIQRGCPGPRPASARSRDHDGDSCGNRPGYGRH